mgnify:CR=1 FL=1
MLGLMQDFPLLVTRLLDHAARWHGGVEIVSRSAGSGLLAGGAQRTAAAIHAPCRRRPSPAPTDCGCEARPAR